MKVLWTDIFAVIVLIIIKNMVPEYIKVLH